MAVFVTLMLVGLGGLALMALPGLMRRGGAHHPGAGAHGPVVHTGHGVARGANVAQGLRTHAGIGARGHTVAHGAHVHSVGGASPWRSLLASLIPEPRAILSLLTLYGASGYMLEGGLHLSHGLAALVAIAPAVLLELALVRPLWNLALSFQGKEASPLDWIVAEQAEAVTTFRNGKGIVRVIHDGRVVQLAARLIPEHAGMPVRVGESLRIEDIDTGKERVTVSLNTSPLTRNES